MNRRTLSAVLVTAMLCITGTLLLSGTAAGVAYSRIREEQAQELATAQAKAEARLQIEKSRASIESVRADALEETLRLVRARDPAQPRSTP